MKYYRALILIIIALFTALISHAQTDPTNIIASDIVYVRSGPDESFPSIQAVFAGETVQPFNLSESGMWVLIEQPGGTGWIPRESTTWQSDIDALPVLPANITPTAAATLTATAFVPTEQPPFGFILISGDAETALVREGPGRGYPKLGELPPGARVDPVSRNADTSWMLIRYSNEETAFAGFGWLSRALASWSDEGALLNLPVMLDTGDGLSLTPTLTFTPSPTVTASFTPPPTITLTPSPTETITPSPTETLTRTPAPTSTIPTATETPTATIPTETSQPTTVVPTSTDEPATQTPQPTTEVPATATSTDSPATATESSTAEAVAAINETSEPDEIATESTPENTPVPTIENTVPPEETSEVPAISAVNLNTDTENPESDNALLPVIGGGISAIVILILLYAGLYARGAASAARYEDGFIIEHCPVCGTGTLYMEGRIDSLFGIPQPRRTVRCNVCRSVLREKGSQQWTYAVDRIENPIIYRDYNGRTINDTKLKDLRKQQPE
ncbi:MAG: SH3 domain-containing protein [Aggregatilineales bacterium]